MFRKILKVILATLCLSVSCASPLGLFVDWATFRGDKKDMAWLELYIKLDRHMFQIDKLPDQQLFAGTLSINITIDEKNLKQIESRSFDVPFTIQANELLKKSYRFLNLQQFELPVGTYHIKVVTKDLIADKQDTTSLYVDLPNMWDNEYEASDIMLSVTSEEIEQESQFNKFGRKMLPIPDRIFDLNFPIAYYYIEFYLPDEENDYRISAKIMSNNTIFEDLGIRWVTSSKFLVYSNAFNINSLPNEEYTLVLELSDTNYNTLVSSSIKFWVANTPSLVDEAPSKEIIDEMHNILYYIAKPDELELFNKLDPDGKLQFWRKFWAEKDPDPLTLENEFFEEYITRWEYANKTFAQGSNTPGCNTDQGRIYIVYGPPDNIDNSGLEISSYSWQIWYYFQKNYYFVFGDITGTSHMKLLHSNVTGEYQDPNWRDKLESSHIPIMQSN